MSLINQAGASGRIASQSFDDNNALIGKQREIGKLKEQSADDHRKYINDLNVQQTANGNLAKTNQVLLGQVEKVALENQKYKELLAKPLGDILQENADYKKAYDEQQALIAMWMLRQRAMKKVAFDLAKQANVSIDVIVDKSTEFEKNVLIDNDNLDGTVSTELMQYFEKHKNYLLTKI